LGSNPARNDRRRVRDFALKMQSSALITISRAQKFSLVILLNGLVSTLLQ
jgi:hypothetical protein